VDRRWRQLVLKVPTARGLSGMRAPNWPIKCSGFRQCIGSVNRSAS
jgi:hypothetical protein